MRRSTQWQRISIRHLLILFTIVFVLNKLIVDHHRVPVATVHVASAAPSNEGRSINFIVVGDWGGPGRKPQRDVAEAMQRASETHGKVDFMVSTGDNIYEDGVGSMYSKKFKRNFENVYVQPHLQCRWYMCLGNHDHGAHGVTRDVMSEVNYTALSNKWHMPAPYYTSEVLGTGAATLQFIVLDSYEIPRTRMSPTQIDWMAKQFAASRARWKIVLAHRPLFSGGHKHGSSPMLQRKLLPHMRRYGVRAYLSGDDHTLQLLRDRYGIVHMVSGAGSRLEGPIKQIPETEFYDNKHFGFVHCTVNGTHMVMRFIAADDTVLHVGYQTLQP